MYIRGHAYIRTCQYQQHCKPILSGQYGAAEILLEMHIYDFIGKKRTLLFEQISTESRYETEVQVTPSSLILLTVFLKVLACVEAIKKEKMKHLSMHKNSFT